MIKDIPGYENYYSIDTEGNVYSKDRIITQINPKTNQLMTYLKKGRKLRPAIKGNGYYGVCLMVNGIGKYIPIHRLLAITFIPNPDNLPCINHKDENKLNNNISNLEWCTEEYNYYYGTATARRRINNKAKKVLQFRKNNTFVASYNTINEAERITGIKHYNICSVCKGNRKYAGGYIWKYAEKEENVG